MPERPDYPRNDGGKHIVAKVLVTIGCVVAVVLVLLLMFTSVIEDRGNDEAQGRSAPHLPSM